jgi:hypothetical protein
MLTLMAIHISKTCLCSGDLGELGAAGSSGNKNPSSGIHRSMLPSGLGALGAPGALGAQEHVL